MGRNLTLKITFSAVAAALTFVATVFIQVPSVDGGYTNLSDAIIFLTAALSPSPNGKDCSTASAENKKIFCAKKVDTTLAQVYI